MLIEYFKSLFVKIKNALPKRCTCGKALEKDPFHVTVFGQFVKLEKSIYCYDCTISYLNTHSIICSACKKPLMPGQAFAGSIVNMKPSHNTMECSVPGSYCGIWDEKAKEQYLKSHK